MSERKRRILGWIVAGAVSVSVVAFLGPAMFHLVGQLSGRLSQLRLGPLAVGFALAMIYWPVNAFGWRMVLSALGYGMPGLKAMQIWLTSQTCRWLPGGIWHYGSRTVQAVAHGVPAPIAVASMVWELLLTVVAWFVLVVAGIAVYGSRQIQWEKLFSLQLFQWSVIAAAVLAVLGGIAMLSRSWLPRLFPRHYRVVQERLATLRQVQASKSTTVVCLVFFLFLAILNSLAFYAVLRAIAPTTPVPLLAAMAANALAWLVGLFALMAPGGLVVREATLALQLSLWMPVSEAVLVAVLWRALQLAVEALCVAGAYALPPLGRCLFPAGRPSNCESTPLLPKRPCDETSSSPHHGSDDPDDDQEQPWNRGPRADHGPGRRLGRLVRG